MIVRGLGRVRGLGDNGDLTMGPPEITANPITGEGVLTSSLFGGSGSTTAQAYADLSNLSPSDLSTVLGTFGAGGSASSSSNMMLFAIAAGVVLLMVALGGRR